MYDVTTGADGSGGIIYMKGGVKSGQMYNNVVRVLSGPTVSTAMSLGGTTNSNAVENTSTTGYECFNCGAWNNVIIGENPGSIFYGYAMVGCKNCGLFNNIIRGSVWNIQLQRGAGDLSNGWAWEPKTKDPILKNNISLDCSPTDCVYLGSAADTEGTVTHDYNLFYNSSGSPSFPSEPHGVYANPQLVNILTDWHLQAGSPARGAGNPNTFIGYFGENIDVSKDIDGVQRVSPWDMGIYAYTTTIQTPTPTLTPTPTPTSPSTPTLSPTPLSDTTPPAITITSPANGSTVARKTNITVAATAADNVGVTQVQFFRNGTRVRTDAAAPYNCAMFTDNGKNSNVTYTAQAFDAAGNSNSINVTVKTN